MTLQTATPRFYFATCQVGAEKAVKAQISTAHPFLKFAFSRPGFITFREDGERDPLQKPESLFVRLWGVVLGQAKTPEALETLLEKIPQGFVVHAFDRDTFVPGDEPRAYRPNLRIQETLSNTPRGEFFLNPSRAPKIGESVYDLIWIDDFHVFLGTHVHATHLDVAPGNRPLIEVPSDAPSRASLKILEAIERFKPEVKKGMTVLEVGCAPGGATSVLLNLGFRVFAIDPKRPDERLFENSNFRFLKKPAAGVTALDLRDVNPDWLVMDMNIAPHEALDELESVLKHLRSNWGPKLRIRHGLITLKLNDWKFADNIPGYVRRLKELGFKGLELTQLAHNRQEFFVFSKSFSARA